MSQKKFEVQHYQLALLVHINSTIVKFGSSNTRLEISKLHCIGSYPHSNFETYKDLYMLLFHFLDIRSPTLRNPKNINFFLRQILRNQFSLDPMNALISNECRQVHVEGIQSSTPQNMTRSSESMLSLLILVDSIEGLD